MPGSSDRGAAARTTTNFATTDTTDENLNEKSTLPLINSVMDDAELSEFFANHWRTSVAKCNEELEDGDREKIADIQTWDDFRTIVLGGRGDLTSVPHQVDRLKPTLVQYSQFLTFCEQEMGTGFSTAFIWGLQGVLFQLISEDPRAIDKIPRMLKTLGYKVEEFNTHCTNASSITKLIREACFDVLTLLLEFIAALIRTLRDNGSSNRSDQWSRLEKHFMNTDHDVNETLIRVEKLTLAGSTGTAATGGSSNMKSAGHPFPCFILPPTKAPRFFDRETMNKKIDDALSRNYTGTSFRSVALHGLGGIGKSAIASRYVDRKIVDHDYDAIFWVQAEKPAALRQSFTEIAVQLQLEGAEPQKHDENRKLVQRWFQVATCRWLIIYDNVESSEMLDTYWPESSHGKAIITSRNHSLAFQRASSGIEILSWNPKTGSEFLFFLLKQAIGKDLQSESISALELSKQLNGHALGILHMAAMIQDNIWTITEFMEAYRKNPRKAHTTGTELEAIWDFSFRSLEEKYPQSLKILGVAAFLMPDNIPQAVFQYPDGSEEVEGFEFCKEDFDFSAAIKPLIALALIKRNRDSKAYSIHRMVQTQYKYFMKDQERQKAFDDAVALVYKVYPQMDGRGQLYDHWAECNYYQQHVVNLADSFKEEHRAWKPFRATWKFCELVNQSQRFLYETNIMDDLQSLCDINTIAVDTLDEPDRRDDLKASVLSHQANLYESIGKVDQAIGWNEQAYQIRLAQEPRKYHLISSFENNLGFCYNTANDHGKAFEYFKRAEATWHSQGQSCPMVIQKNMARCLLHLGQLDEARSLLQICIKGFRKEYTLNWAMVAYAYFALGLIDRREQDFESAEATFIEAQNLWVKGDLKKLHPFNGACMYKTGAVCLDQGKVEAAIKHLRESIEVTEEHMKLMPVEHARSLFKLSEALTQDPQYESEAEGFRNKAEELLLERNPGATEFGSEEPYDMLIPIFWR